MRMNRWMLIGLAALVMLGTVILMLANRPERRATPAPRATAPVEVTGPLKVTSVNLFTVGNRRLSLCGVTFARPAQLRDLATATVKSVYENRRVTCKQVGAGTACDGQSSERVGTEILAQCSFEDGTDLAAELVDRGILCGTLRNEGSPYKLCD